MAKGADRQSGLWIYPPLQTRAPQLTPGLPLSPTSRSRFTTEKRLTTGESRRVGLDRPDKHTGTHVQSRATLVQQ